MIRKIISGGQTGADRGGLDVAIKLDIEHGGWCPHGRKAEDGRIPDRYVLREHHSPGYSQRTQANVMDADATVVFVVGRVTPGSGATMKWARAARKPCTMIDLADGREFARRKLFRWLTKTIRARFPEPLTLNVAGSRESIAPGIAEDVRVVLRAVIDELRRLTSPGSRSS